MGVQMGQGYRDQVAQMCTTYPLHTLLQFVDRDTPEAVAFLRPHGPAVFRHAWKSFSFLAEGQWLEEMQGLVDGAAHPEVTLERLFALNYGPEILFALVYSQQFLPLLHQLGVDVSRIKEYICVPDRCNTRVDARAGCFMRDFQFPNGCTFDKVAGLVVREPVHGHRTACVAAPGMLGGVTMMNCRGLTMGINLIRAPCADVHQLGVPPLLLMRRCGELYESVAQVEQAIRSVRHGVPWLYSAIDTKYHDGAVIGVGAAPMPVMVRRHGWAQPDGLVIETTDQERQLKEEFGVFRACLPETDKLVVTNMTLFPELQEARRNSPWIRWLERTCVAPVYRYLHMIQGEVGTTGEALAKSAFLSPLEPLQYKPNRNQVDIEGALTVTQNGMIYWKVGRWDSEWEAFRF